MAACIGIPIRSDRLLVVVAIIAPATVVEHDVRIGGIHEAVRADFVRNFEHSVKFKIDAFVTSR